MKKQGMNTILICIIALIIASGIGTPFAKTGKYAYETVKNDPLKARIYNLDNGLKVYLTVYKDAPRIQTIIPVRTGSKNDPATTTGLAHYLEHLLFKGTDEYGTLDFNQEKPLLDEIVRLYEFYRQETDSLKRRMIYHHIDSLSFQASQYAIAGEYDKMLSVIGAQGTNAFTNHDMTCYINDIPSNMIKQWLTVEAERFRDPMFRLFHTELEVVYEEKNRALDNDSQKQYEALRAGLWPIHPYGTQSVLGHPDHLKNPSIQNVYDFYHAYYVPNNMAICLSGDFDPDSVIVLVAETFGKLARKETPGWNPPAEAPITKWHEKTVVGPDMEGVVIGYRFPGANTREAELLLVTDYLMMNGVAGIIDLNLKQKQLVIDPFSGTEIRPDYSAHVFNARPREGQSLEETRDLLLAQIDSLKAGAFPEWLPGAVVKNLKLGENRSYENNWGRAFAFVDAFIRGKKWEDMVRKWEFRNKISKKDIVNFANQYYRDNYIVVYKRTGVDSNVIKIQKPPITPVELNRNRKSTFVKTIEGMYAPNIAPVFLDFNQDLERFAIKNVIQVLYKRNLVNDVFTMYYLSDLGNNHNKKLGIALDYLTYLGTNRYPAEQFKQEMYKLGCSFGAWASDDQLGVYFSGLAENFKDGLVLFEHLLANVQPNQKALENLIRDILKNRADAKLNKGAILYNAMYNYGVYGQKSPYRNILSEAELKALTPEELIGLINEISGYIHRVLYYGPLQHKDLARLLNAHHNVPQKLKPIPTPEEFTQLPTTSNQIYVCNYDMKQAEIIMLSKSVPFNRDNIAVRTLFNEYYGGKMSSVVFQELRESRALAYSVYGSYQTPGKPDEAHYIMAYIGTQADKIKEALDGMLGLMNNMARSEDLLENSRNAIIRQLQTERITKESILWRYEYEKRMGTDDHDNRSDIYQQVPGLTMADLQKFFDAYIKDKNYTILVLGDVNKLDFDILQQYGSVKVLELEEVFGY